MKKKDVILVLVFVTAAFLSGTLTSSYGMINPEARPVPKLHTELFTQPVIFSKLWNFTACGVVTPLFNFTITLAGKDPGSVWVDFRLTPGGPNGNPVNVASVFNSTNIPALGCPSTTEQVILSSVIFTGGSGDVYWHVLQSGNYAAQEDTFGFSLPTLNAVESWTVTTIT